MACLDSLTKALVALACEEPEKPAGCPRVSETTTVATVAPFRAIRQELFERVTSTNVRTVKLQLSFFDAQSCLFQRGITNLCLAASQVCPERTGWAHRGGV